MRRTLVGIAALLVLAADAVVLVWGDQFRAPRDDIAAIVPADVSAYGNVFLEPSLTQRRALRDVVALTPASDEEDLEQLIVDFLQEGLDTAVPHVVDLERDVRPHLGDQIGGFAYADTIEVATSGGVVFEADDAAAAESLRAVLTPDSSEPREVDGVAYHVARDDYATYVVDRFVVVGDEIAISAFVAARGEPTLSEHPPFQRATGALHDDRIVTAYIDDVDTVTGMPTGFPDEVTAIGLWLTGDSIVVDQVTVPSEPGDDGSSAPAPQPPSAPTLLADLPADAWLAFDQPGAGDGLRKYLEQLGALEALTGMDIERGLTEIGLDVERDLLSWLEEAAVYVRGNSLATIGGGIVLRSGDAEASAAAVGRWRAVLDGNGTPTIDAEEGDATGFAVPGLPTVMVLALDDRVVIAIADDGLRALEPSDPLGETERFDHATTMLGDYELVGLIDVAAAVELVDSALGLFGSDAGDDFDDIRRWFGVVEGVALGQRYTGEQAHRRYVIQLGDGAGSRENL